MPVNRDELNQLIDTLGPKEGHCDLGMDAEFADPTPITPPHRGDSGVQFDEFTPAAPAPKKAPAESDSEIIKTVEVDEAEMRAFEQFRAVRQAEQRLQAFSQRHRIIESPLNGQVFTEYLKARQYNGDPSMITEQLLEDFFETSGHLLDREDNTPPLPNPDRPPVVYLPESQRPRPIQTGLSSGHQGPSPESEINTEEALRARLANMSVEDGRRLIQRLMYNKGRNQQ